MAFPLSTASPALQPEAIDSVAHVIQTALTPVFMLSGIGTLLNLFNTRLARVSDHLDTANRENEADGADKDEAKLQRRIARLTRRIVALDVAVIFGGIGGALTCGAALALFLGSLRDSHTVSSLIYLFGGALGCVVAALSAFLVDTFLAWHGIRRENAIARLKRALR